ncbi:MAG TPA: class I SAM-dependent methyltransferase [Ohtaekwangia sp.]|nr:class I SAM-dependent methyltransferase [Ohtaekwangia sp.]
MDQKDLFSGHARLYATFRPTYPEDLYQFIFSHLRQRDRAWDCATGNGQVAQFLSRHFKNVFATDISAQQLREAIPANNIRYTMGAAEQSGFEDDQFDLITVGQALHWFDRDRFYEEVNRVGRDKGLLAVWGYAMLSIGDPIDECLIDFYTHVVGPYWDGARKLVDDRYRTIEFPFEELTPPEFSIAVSWDRDRLAGYLESWSATQKYIQTNGVNPVDALIHSLEKHWPKNTAKQVRFPVFMRLGRIRKS